MKQKSILSNGATREKLEVRIIMLAIKAKRSNKTLYLFASIIVTAIAVIMAERQGVVDSDYFWHITLGKSIWQNKAIPNSGHFLLAKPGTQFAGNRSFLAQQPDSLRVFLHFHKSRLRNACVHRSDSLCLLSVH